MMKLKWSYIFAVFALICAVLSAYLYVSCSNVSEIIGSISTIISIILSIVSMHTSYVTEKKTDETLSEIKENNRTLVAMIRYFLSADNYNEENIESLKDD